MKSRILVSITAIIFHWSLAGQKAIYYIDDNFQTITKDYFNSKKNDFDHLDLTLDHDTAFFNVLVKRDIRLKLKPEQYNEIITDLKSYSGQDIKKNSILVIEYYPGRDRCNSSGKPCLKCQNEFVNKLLTIPNLNHFYIHSSNDSNLKKIKDFIKTPTPFRI